MKITRIRAAGAAALAFGLNLTAMPAMAQETGDIQVKIVASAVLTDGELDEVTFDSVGLPAGAQTESNDNFVPTLAVEYFVSPNLSLETICCTTQHDVDGIGPAAGAELVSDALLLPATVTLKYHLNPGGVSPYVGAGAAYFIWLDADPGAAAVAAGADELELSNELGLVLQAGVDVPVGEQMGLTLDAKRYFIGTTARWYANGTRVIETEHTLDPWVLSGGLYYRF